MSVPFESGFRTSREVTRPAAIVAAIPLGLIPAGCFASWQARRVHLCIETNLARRLDIEALARVVNLSPSRRAHASHIGLRLGA
jgi:hypothetical protein